MLVTMIGARHLLQGEPTESDGSTYMTTILHPVSETRPGVTEEVPFQNKKQTKVRELYLSKMKKSMSLSPPVVNGFVIP